jgi:hypothetical protein
VKKRYTKRTGNFHYLGNAYPWLWKIGEICEKQKNMGGKGKKRLHKRSRFLPYEITFPHTCGFMPSTTT